MPETPEEQSGDIQAMSANDSTGEIVPPPAPPKTKTPVHFNQQNNYYQQIPSSAWERLSPEQVVDMSKSILAHANQIDQRHFDFAMDRAAKTESRSKLNLFIGSFVVLIAFGLTTYLATHQHEMIALTISLPLTTILAILVGNQFIN